MKEVKKFYFVEYFDYSVFSKEDDKIQEYKLKNQRPYFEYIGEYKDAEDIKDIVKLKIKKKTISDVVMVIIYVLTVPMDVYSLLEKEVKLKLESLSDATFIQSIFNMYLFKDIDYLSIYDVYPIVFNERLTIDKYIQ